MRHPAHSGRPFRMVAALSAVAVAGLYACGGDRGTNPADATSTGADARPIEEVAAAGPPQVTNLTATDAVLSFASTIPLACAVVYGTTDAYGSIATDQDMAGGAHRDHAPLLTGLQPDTEYRNASRDRRRTAPSTAART